MLRLLAFAPLFLRYQPNFSALHKEMSRLGATLQLLWMEYRQQHGINAYQYTQFTVAYRRWQEKVDVVMR